MSKNPPSADADDPVVLRRRQVLAMLGLTAAATAKAARASPSTVAGRMPIFDAHVHYSHDAVELVPPAQATQLLRDAGLKGALVSSSDDRGTQLLLAEAPDLIVPELRPYRSRADTSGWVQTPEVVSYMEERLRRHRYVGVGEFHLYGEQAELAVPRRMVALAREHGLVLHAHSDIDAVERLFRQWPDARVLWAHSGFERPQAVAEVLQRHPRLWCDLAYRSDHAAAGQVDPDWRAAFEAWPDRFMLGSDTFTPERWHFIGPHATGAREWLATLPPTLADNIGWRNAQTLLRPPASAAACGGDLPLRATAAGKPEIEVAFGVAGSAQAERLPMNRHFALELQVCPAPAGGAPLAMKVDADMPAHRHGMNYRSTVKPLATPGRYRAEGLLLHMPGRWRVIVDLALPGGPLRLTRELDVS